MSSADPGREVDTVSEGVQEQPSVAVDLDLELRSAARARAAVGEVLSRWGVDDAQVRDDVLLLTSELVANAVCHGAETVTLHVSLDDHHVEIAVVDGSPMIPTQPDSLVDNPYREGGRGLLIVSELAQEWGVEHVSPRGKRVWARVPTRRSA